MLSAPFEVGFDIGAQSASFARYRRIPYRAELDLRAPDGRGQRGGSAAEVRSPDFLDASYHFASRLRVKPAARQTGWHPRAQIQLRVVAFRRSWSSALRSGVFPKSRLDN